MLAHLKKYCSFSKPAPYLMPDCHERKPKEKTKSPSELSDEGGEGVEQNFFFNLSFPRGSSYPNMVLQYGHKLWFAVDKFELIVRTRLLADNQLFYFIGFSQI